MIPLVLRGDPPTRREMLIAAQKAIVRCFWIACAVDLLAFLVWPMLDLWLCLAQVLLSIAGLAAAYMLESEGGIDPVQMQRWWDAPMPMTVWALWTLGAFWGLTVSMRKWG